MSTTTFTQLLHRLGNQSLYVLDAEIQKSAYVALDLSVTNEMLQTVDVSSSEKLGIYVDNHIKAHDAKVAFGGYLETRGIYRRSDYFNDTNPETERNIHLGLDLWIAAETPIYTPLDGEVHSFQNNTNFGDYGPTIILKHTVDGFEFYTLYGHLSLTSISTIQIGEKFEKGAQIATLGDACVNGDYPPHLHFQIIKDMQGYTGDYAGVASKKDVEFYKENCPDPNLLLRLTSV
ncbi:peptidoglycan DD-metalloendopeptidase family protein [Kordia sp. YSTF-M3]|uniref:Peptidoglycan DD-metalloendopeptidase family protein n=1 Tax=Kordia aestuariivivens TaxID=2759037 RepID=A0ABR7QFH3_9FLAO|nr:peptidoglycan DD-metalloendopeptidase family protein [Kordia aestuariivivens]MBC8757248.1 peptidoglycan DD-metalloendopeptidase family protein [Kordia aestuariivivens]